MGRPNKSPEGTVVILKKLGAILVISPTLSPNCHRRTTRPAMDFITLSTKPIALLTITLGSAIFFILFVHPNTFFPNPDAMARSFILWLHGLGDSGPANEPIKTFFTSPAFRNTVWKFPSAPSNPVTCNCELF